jgi:hypothetical protein
MPKEVTVSILVAQLFGIETVDKVQLLVDVIEHD